MKTVSLIVPCYNESEVLPLLYQEVTKVFSKCPEFSFELLFVNDGSHDGTLDRFKEFAAKDSRVKYISFSRNFGKEAAMLAGMKYSEADYIGIIDADLQHSPDLIPEMLNALENENYDVAAARRTDRQGEAKIKSFLSDYFYKVYNKVSDIPIEESSQDFRIMKKSVVKAIISMPEYNRFSKGIFSWVGFKTKWFEHENRERAAGNTKWSVKQLLKYAFDGMLAFTTAPLKLSMYFGIASCCFSFFLAIYALIRKILFADYSYQFVILLVMIMFFSGIILVSIGIVGAYLSRIFMEVKDRPLYIVSETNIVPDNIV